MVIPNYLLYVATKGAIEQMTRLLAKDLGQRDISVNCISRRSIATDLFLNGKRQQLFDTIKKWAPANRIGEPEEIVGVMAFSVSDEAR